MLLAEGFSQLQLSVYARYCAGEEIARRYQTKIEREVPSEGQVRVLGFTDVQFSKMKIYEGKIKRIPENAPSQILLF